MDEMKTLTINGVTYEIVDEFARSNANIFVATYGVTASAELEAAYNAGKFVIFIYDGKFYTLTSRWSAANHSFSCPCYNYTLVIDVDENVWGEPYSVNFASEEHTHRFDDNVTGGSANDTVAFWVEKGPGYCWISEVDQVANQPNQYGFLISYVNEGDVFQIFRDQTEGITYYRSGDDINGWFDNWARVITADGDDNITINGVTAKCVEVGDDNSAMGLYTNGLGSRGDNVWIDQAGDAYFTEVNIGTKGNYKKAASETEDWTFTLEDGSTVTKKVYVG